MNDIFGVPGDETQGPQGEYTGGSFGKFSETHPTNVVGPSGGFGTDPPSSGTTYETTGPDNGPGESSVEHLSWERRVLLALTRLQAAKGYKALPPELKSEVDALIDAAPDEAFS